jgi:hypothetical protein
LFERIIMIPRLKDYGLNPSQNLAVKPKLNFVTHFMPRAYFAEHMEMSPQKLGFSEQTAD